MSASVPVHNAALTKVTKRYLLDFSLRLSIFLLILFLYVSNPKILDFTAPSGLSIPLALLWVMMICSMLVQLNSKSRLTKGCLKQYPNGYRPVKQYETVALKQAVQAQNRGAKKVTLLWFCINFCFGVLYHTGTVIRSAELILLCAFYFLCDLICVLFFCPFQYFLMKNRCCVNCRIFAWGSWMMAAPLLLVPHWYAQSLFWTGILVLACWEVRYHQHPERFWYGSNQALQCSNCSEQLCRYKRIRPKHPL